MVSMSDNLTEDQSFFTFNANAKINCFQLENHLVKNILLICFTLTM